MDYHRTAGVRLVTITQPKVSRRIPTTFVDLRPPLTSQQFRNGESWQREIHAVDPEVSAGRVILPRAVHQLVVVEPPPPAPPSGALLPPAAPRIARGGGGGGRGGRVHAQEAETACAVARRFVIGA